MLTASKEKKGYKVKGIAFREGTDIIVGTKPLEDYVYARSGKEAVRLIQRRHKVTLRDVEIYIFKEE